MSIPILNPRRTIEDVSYALCFDRKDEPNCGYSFECDEHGKLADLPPAALANLEFCRTSNEVTGGNIRRHVHSYRAPAEAQCHCGDIVLLSDPLDNTCSCGRCYNMSGQEVIPSWECDDQGNPYNEGA